MGTSSGLKLSVWIDTSRLQIIRDDLHCNAVRICGQDLGRLMVAGSHALGCDLEAWLSPELWDHSPDQTLDHIVTAARSAEELHRHRRHQPHNPRPFPPR